MHEAPIAAYALVGLDDKGRVNSCGVEIVGIHDVGDQRKFFDTSVNFYATGMVLAKLTGKHGRASDLKSMEPAEIYGGWIRAQGKPALVPRGGKLMDGETPKSKLFVAAAEPAAEAFNAVLSGVPLQVAIEWEKGTKTVYFGHASLDDAHRQQIAQCLSELAPAMESAKPTKTIP